MNRMPRALAACLAVAAATAATNAPAWAQQGDTPRPGDVRVDDARVSAADAPPPLPAIAIQGWRLGGILYGGYDTNALDVLNGAGSTEVDLGADGSAGRTGRFSTLEAIFSGGRRQYPDVTGRSGWRGTAGGTVGRRLSKMSVASLNLGYRYDFTDAFALPGVGTQLPRSSVKGYVAEGRYAWKPFRRLQWSNIARFERLDFAEQTLVDTSTWRLRTEFDRQVSRLDRIGPRYEFLRTEWVTRSSDIQSFLAGWRRGTGAERWRFDVQAGATRATLPLASGGDPVWRFTAIGYAALKTGRTAFDLTARKGVTPGYGQGRVLDTASVQLATQYYFTRVLSARLAGAFEQSSDDYDPVYGTQKGAYLDAQVATSVFGKLGIVASYRYRHRDSFGAQVGSNRFGIALTSEIRSSRQRATAGIRSPR